MAGAESTAQQQALIRQQLAASGRDPDLAQSGTLTGVFANIAGQGARTVAQGGQQFRLQALQSAKSDVDKLIEAAQARYTQERDITGKSALIGQQAGMETFLQSLRDAGVDIREDAARDWTATEAKRADEFKLYYQQIENQVKMAISKGELDQATGDSWLKTIATLGLGVGGFLFGGPAGAAAGVAVGTALPKTAGTV